MLVEGANRIKKHTKQRRARVAARPAASSRPRLHPRVSNVAVIHPKTGKPGRLGYRIDDEGKKVRVSAARATRWMSDD